MKIDSRIDIYFDYLFVVFAEYWDISLWSDVLNDYVIVYSKNESLLNILGENSHKLADFIKATPSYQKITGIKAFSGWNALIGTFQCIKNSKRIQLLENVYQDNTNFLQQILPSEIILNEEIAPLFPQFPPDENNISKIKVSEYFTPRCKIFYYNPVD